MSEAETGLQMQVSSITSRQTNPKGKRQSQGQKQTMISQVTRATLNPKIQKTQCSNPGQPAQGKLGNLTD